MWSNASYGETWIIYMCSSFFARYVSYVCAVFVALGSGLTIDLSFSEMRRSYWIKFEKQNRKTLWFKW